MKRPNAALRVVFKRGEDYGLFWQVTLTKSDLFIGTDAKSAAPYLRMSYHGSGATHTYYQHAEHDRQRVITGTLQRLRELRGIEKVGEWGLPATVATWGYQPKPDTAVRKTLVLSEPWPLPLSVDLWIAEQGHKEQLAAAAAALHDAVKVVATLHVEATTPELFAVLWTMSDRTRIEIAALLAIEQRRRQGGA